MASPVLLSLSVLTAGLPVAGLSAVAAADEPPSRLGSPEIFGWLPYWDMGAVIDYGAITTVAYFSIPANRYGRLVRTNAKGKQTTQYRRWKSDQMSSIITRAHAAGVKVVLTVGRFAWSAGGIGVTEALLSSPEARTTLVTEIVNEISNRGVDGVNLDFEPVLHSQRDNFAAFVRELRAAFDVVDPDWQLTFEGSMAEGDEVHAVMGQLTAEGSADAVIIMAYFPRNDGRAGGKAPMNAAASYSLTGVLADYLEEVAPDKTILALPWYGRRFPTQTAEVNSRINTPASQYGKLTTLIYAKALPFAIAHGRLFDPVEISAWTRWQGRACASCPLTWYQVYYDDVDTLGAKYDWAVEEQGLAGIGIWALGYDNAQPELWKLLRVKYRGLVDNAAPTGSFAVASTLGTCPAGTRRLTFNLSDGAAGSGPVHLRLSSSSATTDGVLVDGVTYPHAAAVCWAAPSTVYAQWRDVAGNWSAPQSPSN